MKQNKQVAQKKPVTVDRKRSFIWHGFTIHPESCTTDCIRKEVSRPRGSGVGA